MKMRASFLKLVYRVIFMLFFFLLYKVSFAISFRKIMKTKNSYHIALVLKEQLGMLSKHERSRIPNSTFSDWKNEANV
ncbi:hypothetical protein LEP1GSC121_2931 [Leptospira borgpetersenii serovar Castellonis str. 200801910]|uniref:Uncharacterized protein n=1 Tax=Leptospira borgpetersenii serovar Ballum TaxID=280505 RepID=A0A0S2ITD0_LEPBO|nr:hypothetical protein LBBP_02479 [Leptospira borgpetersenii serovar Ballum]ANH01266.1 Uncharacterized protein LB4E_1962 [Leptospira borgpetersenii str. 4E]EKR01432.1 hypothetical protein LEP1GSC121_2931 [Leptospira borgpetersenii serovar Castellonis str. 200801910]OOV44208.1 hypothetical protein B1H38_09985 [Leptospira borgpetersenii serovar Ballum]